MALHPGHCECEGCQENISASIDALTDTLEAGMGYPAYTEDARGNFPSHEQWWRWPGSKPAVWGEEEYLRDTSEMLTPGRYDPSQFGDASAQHLGGPYAWDPSDFGRPHLGQAFVPGTVLPPMPSTAFQDVRSSVVSPVPGFNNQALVRAAQNSGSGIAPTMSFATVQEAAASAGIEMDADGSVRLPPTIPTHYALAALALLLIL